MKKNKLPNLNRQLRKGWLFILAILFGLISSLSLPAWSNNQDSQLSPQTILIEKNRALELAQQGQKYYYVGDLNQAVRMWQQATEAYRQIDDHQGELKSSIALAQAFYDLGAYIQAGDTLLQVFAVNQDLDASEQIKQLLDKLSSRKDPLSLAEGIGLRSMGNILRRQGLLEQSEQFLQLSLVATNNTPEASATLLSLGNTARTNGNRISRRWNYGKITEIVERESIAAALKPYQAAFNAYQQAAKTTNSPLIQIQAQINQLSLWLEIEQWWSDQANRRLISWSGLNQDKTQINASNVLLGSPETQAFLENKEIRFFSRLEAKIHRDIRVLNHQIQSELATLPPSRTTVYTLINFAECLMRLPSAPQTESVLNLAWQQAHSLKYLPGESYANGYLGKWYLQQKQLDKATQLTQQALLIAQQESINSDVREITYLWQAQLGELLKEQGKTHEAIAAYMAAFNTLQSLRADLNGNIQEVQFDFQQEVKPVYLELASLLLQEQLSASELNSLVVVNPSPHQSYANEKMKGDRLELTRRVIESLQLAELDNFFQDPCAQEAQVAIEIDDIDVTAAVIYPIILPDRLEIILSLPQQSLRQITVPITEQEINKVIQAIHNNLDNVDVDNSASNIFATSNPTSIELQENMQTLLPMFNHLYSWLIQPIESELTSQAINNLVFVINGSLQTVPLAALFDGKQYLIEKYGVALVPSLQLISPHSLNRGNLKVIAAGVSQSINSRGKIFPSLPNVTKELANIQQIFPKSKILLDREFTLTTLQEQIQDSFSILHLATHGLFSSEPNNSFIITGNGNTVNFQQLSQILNDNDNVIPELLVLSACQTATGDEQAVLGLAGIAIRSGASSTLATLWSVEDASTAELISHFYQELKKSEETKLAALRNAQLSLIESLRENPPFAELKDLPPHPYYWAPYVLVGNWL